MSNYSVLKALLDTKFYENTDNEITGTKANEAVKAMVDSLGAGYQFMDVATPLTNPGIPDERVFYIASEQGEYENFGGIIITNPGLYALKYDSAWSIELVSNDARDISSIKRMLGFTLEKGDELTPDSVIDQAYMANSAGSDTVGIVATSAGRYLRLYRILAGQTIILDGHLGSAQALGAVGFFAGDTPPSVGSLGTLLSLSTGQQITITYTANENGYLAAYHRATDLEILGYEADEALSVISGIQDELSDLDSFVKDSAYVYAEGISVQGAQYAKKLAPSNVNRILDYTGAVDLGFVGFPVVGGSFYKIQVKGIVQRPEYVSVFFCDQTPAAGVSVIPIKNVPQYTVYSYDLIYQAPANGFVCVYMQWRFSLDYGNVLCSSLSQRKVNDVVQEMMDSGGDSPSGVSMEYPKLGQNIVCSGSSITWGGGVSVLDSSMVKCVDKFLKERLSKTVFHNGSSVLYSVQRDIIENGLFYGGNASLISGLTAAIEFDLFGDEIAICQALRRTPSAYGVMNVYADGSLIGTFDNKNTVGSAAEDFSGEGLQEIRLSHPCTFNHRIYINGSSTPIDSAKIKYNTGTSTGGAIPAGCDAWIFRAPAGDGSATCHGIQFAASLGAITSVHIEYDYGRIVAHERSTLGQTENEYENENYYGAGNVSFDPDQPAGGASSGMEFRAIDKRAFFIHKFTEYKTRHFRIEIVGGTDPYFIFNFATNRYHNLMNAGIGGWELADLLDRPDKLNHWTQFFRYFKPTILFEEAMTNDDWSFPTRRISRSIGEVSLSELQKMHQLEVHKITYDSATDKYAVEMCTGIISAITPNSLTSPDIVGTATQVGDIVRIGNYHGDVRQTCCRKITAVNTATGVIEWLEPITADSLLMIEDISDLVGAEINIRNLNSYKAKYVRLIESIQSVSPQTRIVVAHDGLPNFWTRQLWGYEIVHAELAAEYQNVEFIDCETFLWNLMNQTITGTRKETVISTGASRYSLSFAGTQYGGWQGFKVLVNGIDVYGKDAYVEMDMAYRLNANVSGAAANKTSPYDRSKSGWNRSGAALTLFFTKNVPGVNDTIEVQYADSVWSPDFCHVNDLGAWAYGEMYCDKI